MYMYIELEDRYEYIAITNQRGPNIACHRDWNTSLRVPSLTSTKDKESLSDLSLKKGRSILHSIYHER